MRRLYDSLDMMKYISVKSLWKFAKMKVLQIVCYLLLFNLIISLLTIRFAFYFIISALIMKHVSSAVSTSCLSVL